MEPQPKLKRRFRTLFWLISATLGFGCVLVTAFTDAPSNIIYHGREVRGIELFLSNLFLIPVVSGLLAGITVAPAAVGRFLKNRNEK
jgi:hypothetical protein